MDANGTRFHLLLGREDWGRCMTDSGESLTSHWNASPPRETRALFDWDAVRGEITLRAELFQFPSLKQEVGSPPNTRGLTPAAPEDRRGADCDRFGNWYWIDESRTRILVRSIGSDQISVFWPQEVIDWEVRKSGEFSASEPAIPGKLPILSGLAVTEQHYLVAGLIKPAGFVYFDLSEPSAVIRRLGANVPFEPFDISKRVGGGCWILDRVHRALWEIDRHFEVVGAAESMRIPERPEGEFHTEGRGSVCERPSPQSPAVAAAILLKALDPVSVVALPDGAVIVVDSGGDAGMAQAWLYLSRSIVGKPASTRSLLPLLPEADRAIFTLKAHDAAILPGTKSAPPRLFIASGEGNQVFAFDIQCDQFTVSLRPVHEYFPMRLFGGKGLVTSTGKIYYDFEERWVPLVPQRRPRFLSQARLFTPVELFDSGEHDCVWHRLMLDGCISSECSVEIWSRAHNDPAKLRVGGWQREPRLYPRATGSELPFVKEPAGDHQTWELLFQRAKGRFLQLQIRVVGSGRSTPRLKGLRAYAPRFSYLQKYLPAVYREDEASARFLERFLGNVEGQFTALEDKIASAEVLFDPQTTPPEALEWLANWLGVILDPAWDVSRRRLFLRHAMQFFSRRGTPPGLITALRLAFDTAPDESIFMSGGDTTRTRYRIVEKFRTRKTPAVLLGIPGSVGTTNAGSKWTPALGAAELGRRYQARTAKAEAPEIYPLQPPAGEEENWRRSSEELLGFIPAMGNEVTSLWRAFLVRRYETIQRLRNAWKTNPRTFAEIELPTSLPGGGPALEDWHQFQSVIVPMHLAAHRFTVLLPVTASEARGSDTLRDQVALADRIIRLQKPAHTVHEIRFYWDYFRVGEARLGRDTLLGPGSRVAELLPPMVLGAGYLAQGYLSTNDHRNVEQRFVLGRESLAGRTSYSRS
jgi:phage tail-like protein